MMERLSTEQRTKVVQFYFESQHSIIQTQRSYRNFFHVRNAPSAPTIYRLVQRFGQQGAVCDLPRAGRPRAVRNEVSIARVQASIEENPETSTRRRSQQLGMARGHQKLQSQAKSQEKQAKLKKQQGHNANEQKKAAQKALVHVCAVCKSQMPDPKTYKQHFENKHPKNDVPPELKDV